jgi:RNA methyltransferase, TrmH family
MTTTTGPLSPRSSRVTAARRLLQPKERRSERMFLVEGPQAVREALDRPGETVVLELFVSADLRERHGEVVRAASDRGVPVHEVTEAASAALSETVTPQGLVAVCRYLDEPLASVLASAPRLVVVLVQVRDPGNAGAVVRVADAAGAQAVVCTEGSVDVYNGKCVRASTGSLFHLPLVTGASLPDTVDALRAAGLQVLAADGAGATDLDAAVDAGALGAPTAWLFGNEAWGLPAAVRALADDVVRVPLHGRAESLNLATAAAVCLYASARELRR